MQQLLLKIRPLSTLLSSVFFSSLVFAQNPLVSHLYTADPTARVFDGRLYIYPSHDVDTCTANQGSNGFCMPDYHVFSTDDLVNWTDHDVIVDQNDVPWGEKNSYGMWAPDAIERDGKYYFYFPGIPSDGSAFRRIGVAVSDSPTGPFILENNYIQGVSGIDPGVFIDDDGQAYLFHGGGETLRVVKLKNNMKETQGSTQFINDLPTGYKEGAFMFKRNGIYYLTFPRVGSNGYAIEYATAQSPMGPYNYRGEIMPNIANGTNHHSIVQYKNQWYIFYHFWSLSGNNRLRSMRADTISFNSDGSIQKKVATIRGIGTPKAGDIIQVDRHNGINNAQIHLVQGNEPRGFQVDYIKNGGWVRFNRVDFGSGNLDKFTARVASGSQGGTLELRINSPTGPLLSSINITNTGDWGNYQTLSADFINTTSGVKDIFAVFKGANGFLFNVNWLSFSASATSIPGRVQAEDYVGFFDNTVGNSGTSYRNDDVDIQVTTDAGGGHNIGWMATNEWLEYPINVTSGGNYKANIRVASPNSSAKFTLEIDGVSRANINISSTGGWQNWTTLNQQIGNLSAGRHTLRLRVLAGGFNVNWIELTQN